MTMLGIETATERLGAALIINDTILERHVDSRSSHCELLTGFISELIDEAGIKVNGIEGIAVSVGPGSFTGLRIGIATVMGLAYALDVKTAGVNTLMALTWNASNPGTLVCPLIDARRSEVYTGIYRTGYGIPAVLFEPSALPIEKLSDILKAQDEEVIITGPAAEQFRQTLEKIPGISISFISPESAKPSAVKIAQLGEMMFRSGGGVSPAALKPVYLRRSDAEIARDGHK